VIFIYVELIFIENKYRANLRKEKGEREGRGKEENHSNPSS
jgi:hypothetical protein